MYLTLNIHAMDVDSCIKALADIVKLDELKESPSNITPEYDYCYSVYKDEPDHYFDGLSIGGRLEYSRLSANKKKHVPMQGISVLPRNRKELDKPYDTWWNRTKVKRQILQFFMKLGWAIRKVLKNNPPPEKKE